MVRILLIAILFAFCSNALAYVTEEPRVVLITPDGLHAVYNFHDYDLEWIIRAIHQDHDNLSYYYYDKINNRIKLRDAQLKGRILDRGPLVKIHQIQYRINLELIDDRLGITGIVHGDRSDKSFDIMRILMKGEPLFMDWFSGKLVAKQIGKCRQTVFEFESGKQIKHPYPGQIVRDSSRSEHVIAAAIKENDYEKADEILKSEKEKWGECFRTKGISTLENIVHKKMKSKAD